MSHFRIFKEKILEKVESFSKPLQKLSKNWNDFTEKIALLGQSMGQKFVDFSEKLEVVTLKFQPEKLIIAEVQKGLETKQLIQGEMTFADVSALSETLWENHDTASISSARCRCRNRKRK